MELSRIMLNTRQKCLIYFLRNTNTMQEIADMLKMSLVPARNFLRDKLGMNYKKAIQEFVWKKQLLPLIKHYNSIKEIAINKCIKKY